MGVQPTDIFSLHSTLLTWKVGVELDGFQGPIWFEKHREH